MLIEFKLFCCQDDKNYILQRFDCVDFILFETKFTYFYKMIILMNMECHAYKIYILLPTDLFRYLRWPISRYKKNPEIFKEGKSHSEDKNVSSLWIFFVFYPPFWSIDRLFINPVFLISIQYLTSQVLVENLMFLLLCLLLKMEKYVAKPQRGVKI